MAKQKTIDKVTVQAAIPFRDLYLPDTHYEPGDRLEVDADRAADLVARGLAMIPEPSKPQKDEQSDTEGIA